MQKNFINIVLYQPEIPQNTGNIARLCVSNDLKLHLIEPLGFKLDDKYLKRSGLDYWQFLNYQTYKNWDEFINLNQPVTLWLLTTKTTKVFWAVDYKTSDYLVFGPETQGLPQDLRDRYAQSCITVPMSSTHSRSLNLASTVQTVYYEAFRQLSSS
jgi:tRNA (cytidine/uridine-2'-O-)-methyltransferase